MSLPWLCPRVALSLHHHLRALRTVLVREAHGVQAGWYIVRIQCAPVNPKRMHTEVHVMRPTPPRC